MVALRRALARTFSLSLDQQFQMLKGNATIDGKEVPVTDARLNGAEIVFTVALDGKPTTFEGKVEGDRIEGKAGDRGWSATKKG